MLGITKEFNKHLQLIFAMFISKIFLYKSAIKSTRLNSISILYACACLSRPYNNYPHVMNQLSKI